MMTIKMVIMLTDYDDEDDDNDDDVDDIMLNHVL